MGPARPGKAPGPDRPILAGYRYLQRYLQRYLDENLRFFGRWLTLQDRRVLLLVERIVRALRQAHRTSTAIAMPDLEQLACKFSSRSGKRPNKSDEATGDAKAAALEANGK